MKQNSQIYFLRKFICFEYISQQEKESALIISAVRMRRGLNRHISGQSMVVCFYRAVEKAP